MTPGLTLPVPGPERPGPAGGRGRSLPPRFLPDKAALPARPLSIPAREEHLSLPGGAPQHIAGLEWAMGHGPRAPLPAVGPGRVPLGPDVSRTAPAGEGALRARAGLRGRRER